VIARLGRSAAAALVGLVAPSVAHAQAGAPFDDARWHVPEVERHRPLSEPPETRDDPGGPVPPGWRRARRPVAPLIGAGAVTGGLSYVLGLFGTVLSCGTWTIDCRVGWIPVAGPIVLLAGGTHLGPMDNHSGVVVTAILAVTQALGAIGTIAGLSWWPSQLIRVTPTVSFDRAGQGGSLGVVVSF
jgi:hypothetical protein